ncbi:MAG: replicative DNA helicase [Desulfobacteraceae bacterium]|nr:replicative DNA helicase [Desulfobacteraceae bacterium]
MSDNEFIPPNSQEAEEGILAAILVDDSSFLDVAEILKPEYFYNSKHAACFEAMENLFADAEPIDLITLKNSLEKSGKLKKMGGAVFLARLVDSIPLSHNIPYHAGIIKGTYQLRELLKAVETIKADIKNKPAAPPDAILESAEKAIFEIAGGNLGKTFTSIQELVSTSYSHFEKIAEAGGGVTGLKTGFSELDEITSGFQNTDLIILAARPAMGKTAMALQFARSAAGAGKSVAFFSVEMGEEQLSNRLICQEGGLDTDKTRSGRIDSQDFENIAEVSRELANLKLFVNDDAGITVQGIRAESRRLAAKEGLGLIVIDYLQLMHLANKGERRDLEIAEISRALKGLAKELNIPIIALSQLNRGLEQRSDKRPILADLRESGALEQDADLVLMPFREEVYNVDPMLKGVAELLIRKHRNGQTGKIHLVWEDRFVRFRQAVTGGL